jgi:Transposase DDE domain
MVRRRSLADHARKRRHPHVEDRVIAEQLEELVKPAVYAQLGYYRQLGLRERLLTLPLMVAVVLTMVWRQVPSVHELTRMLARADLLWSRAVSVTQASMSERFLSFPWQLFERVVKAVVPVIEERFKHRQHRLLPIGVRVAQRHFERVWIVDGSTLEALFRKLDVLQDVPLGQLAGKIEVVIDLVTRLPMQVWFDSNPYASENSFCSRLLECIPANSLVLLDRGFWDYQLFEQLIERQAAFITRLKAGAKFEILRCLSQSQDHQDHLIRLGTGYQGNPILTLRKVEVRVGSTWYRYLTSVLDPTVLPPFVVADLYARRWRIEETFLTIKRLLGLSYLWTGSINGIQLQIWATWLMYLVLVDLADAVADELQVPFESISLEMLYRGLYHFTRAFSQGKATDIIAYFAAPENRDLGIVKVQRKKVPRLDLSPFPGSPGTPLTNAFSS